MDKKKIELKIEELEERIAPARLVASPPPFALIVTMPPDFLLEDLGVPAAVNQDPLDVGHVPDAACNGLANANLNTPKSDLSGLPRPDKFSLSDEPIIVVEGCDGG
ncbi:hypothetical protein MYX64_04875 [Nitrospinae bacterium AH_259_B05_G02_I21]|nr:hypothetical protein [Nitrospinae bacterium AH_259_B05_G02_I21]